MLSGSSLLAGKQGKQAGGAPQTTASKVPRYDFVDGPPPTACDESALDSRTAQRTGGRTGGSVRVSVDGLVMRQMITGIFDTYDCTVAAGGTLVLLDNDIVREVWSTGGEYSHIIISAVGGTVETALRNEVASGLSKGTEATTGTILANEQAGEIAKGTEAMSCKAEGALIKVMDEDPAIEILEKQATGDKYCQRINVILNMVYGLLAMALLVSVLGVVNTLAIDPKRFGFRLVDCV